MSNPTLPTADQVPPEILNSPRWCGYRLEWDSSKQKNSKPPYSPVTGEAIGHSVKWAAHWLPFSEARAGIIKHQLDGLGFVFVDGDGYVGIDFDDCVKDGVIHPVVLDWLKWFPTYAEISPSGKGIHIIGKGRLARAVSATPIPKADGATGELYSHSRYFTFTGQVVR